MIRAVFLCLGVFCIFSSATLNAQMFKNPIIIPTGTDPAAVAMADVNGDGHLDLLYVEAQYSGGTLHVLTGSGTGTFQHGQDVALPSAVCYSVCYINLADINGDGIPDIVLNAIAPGTYAVGGAVAALISNGDGTFQSPVVSTYQPGNSTLITTGKIGVGDLNGDGAADLVLPDPADGRVDVLLGDNTGQFHLGSSIVNLSYPVTAILRDLNGDGHLDVVVLGSVSGTAYVAFGKGDGTFAKGTTYSSGTFSPLFHDVDGDGLPDLVFGTEDGTTDDTELVWMKGKPDGTFAASSALTTLSGLHLPVDIGDYAGNGRADLLVNEPFGFGVYPRNSDSSYGVMVETAGSSIIRSSVGAVGDINGDSHADMAITIPGGLAVFLGNGDGSYQSANLYDMGQIVGSAAFVRFAGSTKVDIAVQEPATYPRLLIGDGTGSFQLGTDQNSSYSSTASTNTLLDGDFNGDGTTDLFETGSPSALFGESSGKFAAPVAEGASAQLVADVNNDGRADLILGSTAGITVQLGQANDTFLVKTTASRVTTFATPVALGDLNGDGKPDLIMSTESGLDIYLGNGDGTFSFSSQILEPTLNINGYPTYASAAIADIDGDGKPDLVYVGTFQQSTSSTLPRLIVLPGNGDGTFGTQMLFTLQREYGNLQVSDLNLDGKPDLVLSDGNNLAVLMNAGGGSFGSEEPYVAGSSIGVPIVGDVNGDGYPDIVVPSPGGTTVTVLLNKTATASSKLLAAILSVSPEPSPAGRPITAALTTSAQPQPTGTVSFFADGQFLGSSAFSSGLAKLVYTGALISGGHVFSAAYGGDSNYDSASYTDLHTSTNATYATSTTLTATPASILTTQTVRLLAKVSAATGAPSLTGFVTFADGGAPLGSASVDTTGTAFLDTSILSVGSHSIVANFLGATVSTYPSTSILAPSSSSSKAVTVSALATATTLSSSTSTTTAGSVISLTATVSSSSSTPFGGVSFFDGTQLLGTISLTGTQATFSTASLASGSHSITAEFNANSIFASSSSTASPVTVQTASTSLATTLTMVRTQYLANGTAEITATVSPAAAGGAVTFLADGVILGSVSVSAQGIAQISGFKANGVIHILSASLSPTLKFAPSVSPTSYEGWLSSAPGFALTVDTESILVAPGDASTLQLNVAGLSQVTGSVTLSCILPSGSEYTCSLGTQQLGYGASTTVTITAPQQTRAEKRSPSVYLTGVALILLIRPLRKRQRVVLLTPVALFSFGALIGCGSAFHSKPLVPAVLKVQAIASDASHSTERTIEVFINP